MANHTFGSSKTRERGREKKAETCIWGSLLNAGPLQYCDAELWKLLMRTGRFRIALSCFCSRVMSRDCAAIWRNQWQKSKESSLQHVPSTFVYVEHCQLIASRMVVPRAFLTCGCSFMLQSDKRTDCIRKFAASLWSSPRTVSFPCARGTRRTHLSRALRARSHAM